MKSVEPACPFCGETFATGSRDARVLHRMSRAALFGGAGMMLACGTTPSPQPAYGACPPDAIELSAPCGVQNITTTCTGATASCAGKSCTVQPIASDCSVTVLLGDGTTHTVAVTVSKCPFGGGLSAEPAFTDLTSASCQPADGGTDAATDAPSDASSADAADGD